ncbi:uncharacterized protein [Dermacentor albipictus]|uniref:uncharacterized protein isoform X2 n=1 Tax=Dermacentor albipictus TaxID=60249 RepID=UPI0038FD146A
MRYSWYVNRVKMNKWRRQQQLSDDLGRLKECANVFYDVYRASVEDRSHIERMLRLEKEMQRIIEPPGVELRGLLSETKLRLAPVLARQRRWA